VNNKIKIIITAAVVTAFPLVGLACGDQGCDPKTCEIMGANQPVKAYHGKAGKTGKYARSAHHLIPGNSPAYIRKILKKADALDLTEKQLKQVGDLLVQAETSAAKVHAESQIEVASFRTKLHSKNITDKDVTSYTKRMGELRAAKLSANLKASVAASRLLSDEQMQKLYAKQKASDLK